MLRDLENDKLIKQISALPDSMMWLERRHVERGEPEAAQMLRAMIEWNEERLARLVELARKELAQRGVQFALKVELQCQRHMSIAHGSRKSLEAGGAGGVMLCSTLRNPDQLT